MRLRWQLALGGGVLALGVLLLAGLLAGTDAGRLTDPLPVVGAVLLGGGGGFLLGAAMGRSLGGVAETARNPRPGAQDHRGASRLASRELVELRRALEEVRARQSQATAELRGEIERLEEASAE